VLTGGEAQGFDQVLRDLEHEHVAVLAHEHTARHGRRMYQQQR
jgi:hypothetical protein